MSQTRPTFHPVADPPDIPDHELAKFSKKRGLPSLVPPANESPAAAPQIAQDASSAPPRTPPSPETPAAKKNAPATKRASATTRLAVELPAYLSDAVNIRAAQERASARYLVMKGLKAIGFEIDDADMAPDARRAARKRRRS